MPKDRPLGYWESKSRLRLVPTKLEQNGRMDILLILGTPLLTGICRKNLVITSVLMERNSLLPTTLMQVDVFIIYLKDMEEITMIGLNIGWRFLYYKIK